MKIQLNGQLRSEPSDATVHTLLAGLQLEGRRLAVERNGEIVPRSAWTETALTEGDVLEIVHAIGGG